VDSRLTDGTVILLKVVTSFITQYALQVHSQFQTEFSGKCDLVLPLLQTVRIKSIKIQQCVEIFTGINESWYINYR